MKNLKTAASLFLVFFLFVGVIPLAHAVDGIAVDEIHFPDANFRGYVSENCDTDGDGFLTDAEIAAVTELNLYGLEIKDLTGVACFTSLTRLNCTSNQLTALDVSENTALTSLWCNMNQLTELDVSRNAELTSLHCFGNHLQGLDLQANTKLTEVDCGQNPLSSMDLGIRSPLQYLGCANLYLTSLDVSMYPQLQRLDCSKNQLTELDVRGNAHLNNLWCTKNRLTNLEVSANTELAILNCAVNQLTELDVHLNPSLTYLSCAGNQLTNLNLSQNTALTDLNCGNNPLRVLNLSANTSLKNLSVWNLGLTSLDVSMLPNLEELICGSNQLTELDVSQNSALNYLDCSANQLTSIDVSANSNLRTLSCNDNRLASLDLSANTVLRALDCSGNRLTSLDLSGKADMFSFGYHECGNQTADAELTELDGAYWLDLAALVGPENVERVTVTSVTPEDAAYTVADGILTAESELTGVVYAYSHGGADSGAMEVTLSLTTRVPAHIAVDEMNFPDAAFRGYVSDNCDTNADGFLDDEELAAVTEILVSRLGISDLRGIEYFTSLTRLDCSYNQLTSLDTSENPALTYLYCYKNQLTSLNVSANAALTRLECFSNQLDSLDVSHNTALKTLECGGNPLTSLDVSGNTSLSHLYCWSNQLISLDISNNTSLVFLECSDNQLTTLNLNNNTKLETLACGYNQLESIDISHNTALKNLTSWGNLLTVLDISSCPILQDCVRNGTETTANGVVHYNLSEDEKLAVDSTVILMCGNTVIIDETYFPDANFRSYVSENCDTNHDGELSSTEIMAVTYLNVGGLKIIDLTGIEYFTSLNTLYCFDNQITSLDVCANRALTSLNVAGCTALTELNCGGDQLTSLNVSGCTGLTSLNCADNQLTSLDVSTNTALTSLNCYNNKLTSLDVSANAALTCLECSFNQLPTLDVSGNTALTELYCYWNKLTVLDASANTKLEKLSCGGNQLTALDVSANTKLFSLRCENNHLTSLNVHANPSLTNYSCNFSGQTATADLLETDGMYRLDLAALVGAEYVDRVTVTTVTPADAAFSVADGIFTAETELTGLTYTYAHGGPDGVTMDVTLDLRSNGETYTVSYDANGGTAAPAAQTKTNRRTLLLRDDHPTRSGWYFLGWAERADAAAAAYLPGDSFCRDADTTLYAVWAQPDLVLPAGLTAIEEEAFAGAAFSFVKLPQHTVSIERNAFADCEKLVCVYIPAELTDIDPLAFGNASELTIIGVSGSAAETFAHEHGFRFLAE